MWITSLCTFPPLFYDVPFPIDKAGFTITQSFAAPVDKEYYFEICFEFASIEARKIDAIVGNQYDKNHPGNSEIKESAAENKSSFGRVIPFKIKIKNKSDEIIIYEQIHYSHGVSSLIENKKFRTIGIVELKKGDYIAEVTCIENQNDLNNVITKISLTAGHGK